MYAVIETGGKQYRVELGSEVAVERLNAAPGETIEFGRVLLVADGDDAQIGTPTVAEALVTGEVLRQDRGDKVIVFKYRPKARHRAKKGHRQEQTVVRVADIRFNGRSAADEAGSQEKEQTKARRQAAAEAEKKAAADQALAAKLAEAESAEAPAPEASEASATAKAKTITQAPASPDAEQASDGSQAAGTKTESTPKAAAKATKTSGDKPATGSTTANPATRRTATKKDE